VARVHLQGLPRLKAKLQRLRQETAEDVRPALARAAQLIVEQMKRLAPVSDAPRQRKGKTVNPGALRDSIGWTFGGRPRHSQALAVGKVGRLRVTIFAGNDEVRYAHLQEFGSPPHIAGGKFEGARHPGHPAQPFFFPGYRAMRREAKRLLAKAIRDAVRKRAAA
jgi:HK97 gp10 family phage protein